VAISFRPLVALATVVAAGCGSAFGPDYRLHKNLVYDSAIGGAGYFDLYVPPGEADRRYPALVVIHGGCFESLDKSWARSFAGDIASHGIVVMAINYREAPQTKWPGQLEDCRKAVRFLRENAANLAVDPERIGSLGGSCGACLASLLALEDDPLADRSHAHLPLFIDAAGESDFSRVDAFPNQTAILTDLFGSAAPWPRAMLDAISPIKHVRPDVTALVIHGDSDPWMNVAQSDRFVAALTTAGARVTYLRRNSSEHSNVFKIDRVNKAVVDFVKNGFSSP
jgi:acetyl esterase/lipase